MLHLVGFVVVSGASRAGNYPMAMTDGIVLAQAPERQAPARVELGPPGGSSVTINVNAERVVPEAAAKGGDLVGLVQVIAWPLILLILAIVFRRQLRGAFAYVASNVKPFSIAGVSVELSERSAPPMVEAGRAAVDIRQAGTENNVNDSTLRSFYDQIEATSPLELAIVDLGAGHEWLTSRLYILSVILKRMRGLRAVVFVGDANDLRGRLIGICSSEVVRWRLAREFPKYEEALASGELRAVRARMPPHPLVDNDEGRFFDRNSAAELLRGFLQGVQAPFLPAGEDEAAWQNLTAQLPAAPVLENAKWLDAPLVERLLAGALDMDAIPASQFQFADRGARARIVLEHGSPWVPLVRVDGRFHGWIDRSVVVESLARHGLNLQ